MRKLYLTTGQSKFYLDDDKITKVCDHIWEEDRYHLYKKFREKHSYCVDVVKWVSDREIQMEKLDIAFTVDDILQYLAYDLHPKLTKERLHRAVLFFQQVHIDFLNFSMQELPEGKYFYHTDTHLLNFVFTTDDEIKLIDPNSFQITTQFVNTEYTTYFNRLMWRAHLTMQRLETGNKYV